MLVILTFLLLPVSLCAEQKLGTVIGTNVNIRSQPAVTSKVITQVNDGEIYTILEHKAYIDTKGNTGGSGWYKITLPKGEKGWIYGAFFGKAELVHYLPENAKSYKDLKTSTYRSKNKTFDLYLLRVTLSEGGSDYSIGILALYDKNTRTFHRIRLHKYSRENYLGLGGMMFQDRYARYLLTISWADNDLGISHAQQTTHQGQEALKLTMTLDQTVEKSYKYFIIIKKGKEFLAIQRKK
jgi:hypothetical protein